MNILKGIFNFIIEHLGLIIFLALTSIAIYLPYLWKPEGKYYGFIIYLLLTFYMMSFILIFYRGYNFQRYTSNVKKIILYYIEMILVFSSIYLWLFLLSEGSKIKGFTKFDLSLLSNKLTFNFELYFDNIIQIIIDSIYFSVTTASTLGYGDFAPTHISSKIVVIIQVLVTVSIVLIGIVKTFQDE
ncbi:MAG: two pore domain potassium channel family protein [Desulfobacterales bacterium]|nr:two pore domain potassium channel family protein [Desulfobacterales bacterium]